MATHSQKFLQSVQKQTGGTSSGNTTTSGSTYSQGFLNNVQSGALKNVTSPVQQISSTNTQQNNNFFQNVGNFASNAFSSAQKLVTGQQYDFDKMRVDNTIKFDQKTPKNKLDLDTKQAQQAAQFSEPLKKMPDDTAYRAAIAMKGWVQSLPGTGKVVASVLASGFVANQRVYAEQNAMLRDAGVPLIWSAPTQAQEKRLDAMDTAVANFAQSGVEDINKAYEEYNALGAPANDMQKYIELVALNVPQLATTAAATTGTLVLTKNPALATTVGLSLSYAYASSEVYTQAISMGVEHDKAAQLSMLGGALIAPIDLFPIGRLARKVGGQKLISQALQKNLAREFVIGTLKQQGLEVSTEVIQEIIHNGIRKTYDENAGWFENIKEAAIVAFILGGFSNVSVATAMGLTGKNKNQTPEQGLAEVEKNIEQAFKTPEDQRTPQQQEIVEILTTQELSPQNVAAIASEIQSQDAKLSQELMKAVVQAQESDQNIQVKPNDSGGLEITVVPKIPVAVEQDINKRMQQLLPPGEYPPHEVRNIIIENELQNTPVGKELIKRSITAQEQGQSLVIDQSMYGDAQQDSEIEQKLGEISEELQELASIVTEFKNASDFVSYVTFNNSIPGETIAALEAQFSGETTADKLTAFYKQVKENAEKQQEIEKKTQSKERDTTTDTTTDKKELTTKESDTSPEQKKQEVDDISTDKELPKILRGTKGLTADDIMKTYPNIRLTRDVRATDIHGNKATIPEGEALTPYELKGNKILLQDGETYLVSKNQFENIKGNSIGGQPKPFAPELEGLDETVKGQQAAKTIDQAIKIAREKKDKEGVEILKRLKILDREKHKSIYGRSDERNIVNGLNHARQWVRLTEDGRIDLAASKNLSFESVERAREYLGGLDALRGGKYNYLTLPGGKNYKEILIKAPVSNKPATREEYGANVSDAEYNNYLENFKAGISENASFQSNHWSEKGVISHLRMNERTYKGKKVAFMEELQSDWAREGRSKGFQKDTAGWTAKKTRDGSDGSFYAWEVFDKNGKRVTSIVGGNTPERAIAKASGQVPNNPLLKNWQELTIKRALKEALDSNAQYFSWINGEQTTARYNLATHIKKVSWKKPLSESVARSMERPELAETSSITIDTKDDQQILMRFNKEGTVTSGLADWEGKRLDEVLGKGLADKIMEKESGSLAGEGLKFGGEWANNLYDKQVSDIVRKVTGANIETIDMGLPIEKRENFINQSGRDAGGVLTQNDLKVGHEINREGAGDYVITNVLKNGKFKAVAKSKLAGQGSLSNKDIIAWANDNPYSKEEFDISGTPTVQQAIRLTPEVKAKIRGQAPEIKTSGKMFAEPESVAEERLTDMRKARPGLNEVGSLTPDEVASGVSRQFENLDDMRLSNPNNKGLLMEVLSDSREMTPQGLKVYRVVPKGKNIGAGDFVFDTKKAAEAFIKDKPTGSSEIKEVTAKLDDLLTPTSGVSGTNPKGEFIYAPRNVAQQQVSDKDDLTLAPSKAEDEKGVFSEIEQVGIDENTLKFATDGRKNQGAYRKQPISKTQLKALVANSDELRKNPVFVVDKDKNLVFNGKTQKFVLNPEGMGINADRLVEGNRIKIDLQALKTGKNQQLRVFKQGKAFADSGKIAYGQITEGNSSYYQKVQDSKGETDNTATRRARKDLHASPLKVKFKEDQRVKFPDSEIRSPADIAWTFQELRNNSVESFYTIGLKDGNVVSVEFISMGTIDSSLVDPYEITDLLRKSGADSVYLLHNHPSGDPTPSKEDVGVQQRIKEGLDNLGIKLEGQVIINTDRFGFIDSESNDSVMPLKKTPGKEKEMPVYKKYIEWTQDKPQSPTLMSPVEVANFAKGVTTNWTKNAMVINLNVRNVVTGVRILPKNGLNTQALIQSANEFRSKNMILVNHEFLTKDLVQLRGDLRLLGVNLLDAINVDSDGFRSASFDNVFEQKSTYDSQVRDADKKLVEKKGTKTVADIDNFTEIENLTNKLEGQKSVPLPEMVRLATDLMGRYPSVHAKMRSRMGGQPLGLFVASGDGEIRLNAAIFKDVEQTAKTLAHEIGHLADYIPDHVMARGNILGRIGSLNNYTLQTFTDAQMANRIIGLRNQLKQLQQERRELRDANNQVIDRTENKRLLSQIKDINKRLKRLNENAITNKTVKKELVELSKIWRGDFDPTLKDPYNSYRSSATELYADALSVLLVDPVRLQQTAPTFHKAFFENLDTKPEFQTAYFELQEFLHMPNEVLNKKRIEQMYKDYEAAEAQREAIEDDRPPEKPFFETFMMRHVTQFDPIYRMMDKKFDKHALAFGEKARMRMALEEMQMRKNNQYLFLHKLNRDIIKPLENLGMDTKDLGVLMNLQRNLGDRREIANPYGLQGDYSQEALDFFKQNLMETRNLTQEQYSVLEQMAAKFREFQYQAITDAHQTGYYSNEFYNEIATQNKDTYVTYQVIEYIHNNYVSAGIKQATGTVKPIENPFVSSVMKTVAVLEQTEVQKGKRSVVDQLKENFDDEITKAVPIKDSGGRPSGRYKPEKNREVLELYEDGKRVGYYVDPYIKQMFDSLNWTPSELHTAAQVSGKFNRVFKPLVTTFNLTWGLYSNIARDTKRTYKNLATIVPQISDTDKNVSVREFIAEWIKAIPQGKKFQDANLDSLLTEMLESKAFSTPFNSFDPTMGNDTALDPMMRKFKLMPEKKRAAWREKTILKPLSKIMEAIEYGGSILETTTKVAGYQILDKRNINAQKAAMITRNWVGTPNFMDGGTKKQFDNNYFVFSNVIAQALRTDAEIATSPQTRSGYWYRTFMVDILPKLAMVAAASGLLGAGLKEIMDKATEYDKTNFIVVPLAIRENGKAVYLTIPQDETGRLISALVWKLGSAMNNDLKQPLQVMQLGAGYIPTPTPLWEVAGGWVNIIQGRNPYDGYRGRLVVDDNTWKAGGLPKYAKLMEWTFSSLGFSQFTIKYDSGDTGFDMFIKNAPVIKRAVRSSDYGLVERERVIKEEIDAKNAKRIQKERKLLDDLSEQAKKNPDTQSALKQDFIDQALELYDEEKQDAAKRRELAKKFDTAVLKGSVSRQLDSMIYANTHEQKIELLKMYKSQMKPDEYKEFLRVAVDANTISDDLRKKLRKQGLY